MEEHFHLRTPLFVVTALQLRMFVVLTTVLTAVLNYFFNVFRVGTLQAQEEQGLM